MLVCSALGIGVEAVVVTVVWATGTVHTLAGIPSAIGITAAIVCGLLGGRVSGGLVGAVNAVLLLLLARSGGSDIALLGLPTLALWFVIGFGTGAAADYLRQRLDEAFTDLRRANDSAQQVASTLQRSLLPERLPHVPGVAIGAWFRPAGDGSVVGGDFYDVWLTGPERFGAMIGDVCGKGTQAASVTALARHTMRTASMLDQPPAEILRVVNDAIRRRVGGGQFCTALALSGQPHPDGYEVAVACGGHHPPIVIRADGDHESVGRPGTLLGIWEQIDVGESRAVLRPGDSLVLWTDGITDRRGVGERFGQERLERLLTDHAGERPDRLAGVVGRASQDFADEVPQDDAAVLVLGLSVAAT